MATELGVAYLSIAASTGGMGRDIEKAFGVAAGGAGAAGQKAGKGYMKGFAVGGAVAGVAGTVVSGLMSSIGALASEAVVASDATDKFRATLDFAGLDTSAIETVTKQARAYADQTVYDLGDIQNTSAQLAANGIKGYQELTEATGNLNAVAGGNAETFKRVGMVLTQTAGAGKLTTENWNQLSDAIPGASGSIQDALRKNGAFTGNFRDAMAKGQITADEFNAALLELGSQPVAVEAAKSTKTFEGAIGNLKATVVGGLSDGLNAIKPALTGAITAVADGLGGAIGWLKSALPPVVAAVKSFFGSFGAAGGVGAIGSVVTLLSPFRLMLQAIKPLLPQIGAAFAQVGGQLASALLPLLGQLAPMLQDVVGVVGGGLTSVFAALLPTITQIATAVLPVFAQVLAAVVPVFLSLVQAVLPVVPLFAQLVSSLLPPLAGLIGSLVPVIMPLVGAVLGLVQAFLPLIGVAIQLVQSLLPPLMAVIAALIPPITEVVAQIAGALVPVFDAVAQLVTTLMPIIAGLVGVIGTIVGAVAPVIAVIAGGLVRVLGGLITIAAKVVAAIVRFVADGIKGIGDWASGIAAKIGEGIALFTGLKDKIGGALAGADKWLVDTGANLLKGLWAGVSNTTAWLKNRIGDAMQAVIDWVKAKFGIHSPSRVFKGIGVNLMQGMAGGISVSTSTVTAQMDAVSKLITDTARKAGKAAKKVAKAAAGIVDAQKSTTSTMWSDEATSAASLSRMLSGASGGATLADFAQARSVLAAQVEDAQATLKSITDARDQMAGQIASSMVGELDLAEAMKATAGGGWQKNTDVAGNTWYSGGTTSSGGGFAGISASVKGLAAKAMVFAGKLKDLVAAGYPAGLVQEVAGYGSATGIGVADALLHASTAQRGELIGDYGALTYWSGQAGAQVAEQMYGVGIAAQQGIVDGLLSDDAKLAAAAESLANTLTKAVKKKLGIKSPSRVFRDQVGLMVAKGTAQGLDRGRSLVASSARSMLDPSMLNGGGMDVQPARSIVYSPTYNYPQAEPAAVTQNRDLAFAAALGA